MPAFVPHGRLTKAFSSPLLGVTARIWLRLLRDNGFRVDPPFFPRAGAITLASVLNGLCRHVDAVRLRGLSARSGDGPIFILGHWRSGTTLLHNLLVADPRFAGPDLSQALFPHSFLTLGVALRWLLARSLPEDRIIDRMAMHPELPQEDEFALCALTGMSPYLAYVFPKNWARYDRYLTFDAASESEVRCWQRAFRGYVAKLGAVHGRQLVLKSPPHTARLRWLLDIFPQARFVHICRDPYAVFQSTCRMLTIGPPMAQLQRFDFSTLEATVLTRYATMYDAFLKQRALIPPGRLHELRFEDLVSDPLGQLERIYDRLDLPDFAMALPTLRRVVATMDEYRPTYYPALSDAQAKRIAECWQRFFSAWGYPTDQDRAAPGAQEAC